MRNLSQREKTLLKIFAIIIIIVAIYYLIALPLIRYSGSTEDELSSNADKLNRLEKIYQDYRKIQQKKSRYNSLLNKKNENITSLVEQWASSTGIERNIAYTRRTQNNVQNKYIKITTDIKIEGVAIQPFLKFIYEIENSDNLLKISYLRIREGLKGTSTYDINMKIDSFTTK